MILKKERIISVQMKNQRFLEKVHHFFLFMSYYVVILDFQSSFLNNLNLFSVKVFLIAIIFSIIISLTTELNPTASWIEGFAIFLAMIICVLVSAITEYQLDNEFLKLNNIFELSKEVQYFI